MKYRKTFVSNSSTSSYACAVCYDIETGMDLGLHDANMFECVNGHTVHWDCADVNIASYEFVDQCILQMFLDEPLDDEYGRYHYYLQLLKEEIVDEDGYELDTAKKWWDSWDIRDFLNEHVDEWLYEIPDEYCPICSFSYAINKPVVRYLMNKYQIHEEELLSELREKYSILKNLEDEIHSEIS